jgi:hypothetical protein
MEWSSYMIFMYDTNSGFQPTKFYKSKIKPNSLSWDELNRKDFENRKHWLCFHFVEVKKTFNVYYPNNVNAGDEISILIDTNNPKGDWDIGLYRIDWIESKPGLFQQKIQPLLNKWIEEMGNQHV